MRLCTKDEMPGAEGKVHVGHQAPKKGEGAGSVLTYVTEPESRKQRRRSPLCNCLISIYFCPHITKLRVSRIKAKCFSYQTEMF